MDGRLKRVLAGGLLAGAVGCTTTQMPPPNPLTAPPPPPPVQPTKNTVFVQEPTDDGEAKTGPIGPRPKLLYANMCIEALSKDPNRPAADRERTLTQVRELFQEVLATDPKNVEALMGLGEMYQLTGERDRLTEVMGRVTTLYPNDAKAWAWVAVKHGQAKNWTAAADAYGRAAKVDPDNRTYRLHLGFTLARAGRYDEGYEWLGKAMREADARYNLAMMMLHNGEADRARAELERCLKADPNFSPAAERLAALAAGNPAPPAAPTVADVKGVGFEELAPVQLNHGR
jgi:tetratricopeptide (TPR) repeat protein